MRRGTLALAMMLCVCPRARAQEPAPAPLPPVTAGTGGIAIQSANGDFRLQIGLLAHADARFAFDDEAGAVNDTFLLRRLRPYLRGRLARRFEFLLNPDFAGSTLVVQDAYLDTVFSSAFRLRIGKGKTPFGMERLHSAANLLFFERALPTALVPNRDVGLQALGDLAGGRVSYLAGVMNGVPDGASGDIDNSDSKDVAGRLIVRPLPGVAVAVSGAAGTQSGAAALPTIRTASLQQTFFSYTGTVADGLRTRYSPQLSVYRGRFGGLAEYVHTETEVTRGTVVVQQAVTHEAWQVAASWVLTGEAATDAAAGIAPRNSVDFGAGNWGAFQVAARYHTLAVDEDAFTLGLATAGSSRTADAWTAGLNWYLTQNFRYTFNFERTVFDGGADGARPAENALAFRTQISF